MAGPLYACAVAKRSAICDPGEHASRGDSIVKATSIARENPTAAAVKLVLVSLSLVSNPI